MIDLQDKSTCPILEVIVEYVRNQDSETEMYFRVFFIPKQGKILFLYD